ncbi:MAG: TlpA family protein disulfide reductase [Flavobacteriales bacterium]|nr:MAG: TlpA family protein disulfide reductase [Flavobacteriales bacterium]
MNKILERLFICLTITLLSLDVLAQQTKASLTFTDKFSSVLNGYINYESITPYIENKANLVTNRHFNIDKPTHFFYSTTGAHVNQRNYQTLLLLPSDSIVIAKNGIRVAVDKGYSNYIDSLISMGFVYSTKNFESYHAQNGVLSFIKDIEQNYLENKQKIKRLNLDERHREALSDFNTLVKYTNFTHILNWSLLKDKDVKTKITVDSLSLEMIAKQAQFEQLNSPFINLIYSAVINYSLEKKGINSGDQFNHLDKIANLPFFHKYLISTLHSLNIYDPFIRDELYNKIKVASLADAEIDRIYEALKTQKPLMEKTPLLNAEKIMLVDINQQEWSLQNILNQHKGKLFIVDFWASWCMPCRMEFPAWKKAKANFKGKNIVFLNFSIDEDDRSVAWKKALQEEKENANSNQYRLVDWKNSSLTKQLELRSIPRYIIIDDKGFIRNNHFYKPSDNRFNDMLKKYIVELQ